MPHFDEYGGDEWICQICGKIQNSQVQSEWSLDITQNESAGNICPRCKKVHDQTGLKGEALRKAIQGKVTPTGPISLYEHCRRESGLEGMALQRYINRYYGHG
jgi:hypothetical protein